MGQPLDSGATAPSDLGSPPPPNRANLPPITYLDPAPVRNRPASRTEGRWLA
jgi:hypothetical protein